jgi:predicted transcriptional regulator
MKLSDEEFREEYKPLHIPSHFDQQDTQQNKAIYALAQIGEGTADKVLKELETLQPGIVNEQVTALVKTILANLFDKGLIKGEEHNGQMHYNLSKITEANDGSTGNQ